MGAVGVYMADGGGQTAVRNPDMPVLSHRETLGIISAVRIQRQPAAAISHRSSIGMPAEQVASGGLHGQRMQGVHRDAIAVPLRERRPIRGLRREC